MVDLSKQKPDNSGGYLVFEGADGQQLKVKKADMYWTRTGDHEHHYLPDFSDETDTYVALKCAKGNCVHGVLQRKEGKDFMSWLEERRTKA